jgi:Holliday junction resolvasome RuvABC endonuclease subunit
MRQLSEIKPAWIKEFGTLDKGPNYVGIDPSLSAFAIVAVTPTSHYGQLIKVPPSLWMGERLVVYQHLIEAFFASIAEPDLVFVEGPGYGGHATSAWALGGLNGALAIAAWHAQVDYRLVSLQPSTLKKYITNNGNAKKNTIVREVFKVWEFDALDDNCADAFGLAQAAMTVCTNTARYAWQLAALKKQISDYAERTGPTRARPRAQPDGSRPGRRVVRRHAPAEGGRRL